MRETAFSVAFGRAAAIGTWAIAVECGIRPDGSLPAARQHMESQMSADTPTFAAAMGVTADLAWMYWGGLAMAAEVLARREYQNYPEAACARVRRLLPPRGMPT